MKKKSNSKKNLAIAAVAGLLYLPFGVIFELTKKYNKPRRRRK